MRRLLLLALVALGVAGCPPAAEPPPGPPVDTVTPPPPPPPDTTVAPVLQILFDGMDGSGDARTVNTRTTRVDGGAPQPGRVLRFTVEAGGGLGDQGRTTLTVVTDAAGVARVLWQTTPGLVNLLRIATDSAADRVIRFDRAGTQRPRGAP